MAPRNARMSANSVEGRTLFFTPPAARARPAIPRSPPPRRGWREAGAVVVDPEPHPRFSRGPRGAVIAVGEHFDGDARLRPFAGVVDEVADHLLEVLPLAAKADRVRRLDVDGDAAAVVDLLH